MLILFHGMSQPLFLFDRFPENLPRNLILVWHRVYVDLQRRVNLWNLYP